MKLQDLENRNRQEQYNMIDSCDKVVLKEAIKNPENFAGKFIALRGNYAGFSTEGLCIRTFEYIPEKEKWQVSDIDLSDMFRENFDSLFDKYSLERIFACFCMCEGFILEK